MNKNIKYGTIVQVKKPVVDCYFDYEPKTKQFAPDWMKKHNGRAIIKHGPYIDPNNKNNKSWGIKWENTGQGVTVNETEFEVVG